MSYLFRVWSTRCSKVRYFIGAVILCGQDYKYDGDYNERNQRHGHGRAEFTNGDRYEGAYANGKRNGFGVYR